MQIPRQLVVPWVVILGLAAGPAYASEAQPPVKIDLAYEFYFGGLHVLSLVADATLTSSRYDLTSRLRTRGLFNVFFKSTTDARSEGGFAPATSAIPATPTVGASHPRPVPTRFETATDGKWGARSVAMVYDLEGPASVEVEPPYHQDNRLPVTDELRRATLDPQTAALLSLAFKDGGQSCGGSVPVFDGRRRYNLNFIYQGMDQMKPSGQGVYEGPAVRCRLVYERIAGFDEKYAREHGDEDEQPFTVWIASFENGRFHLPVKMMADTRFGKALGHLSVLQFTPISAQLAEQAD